MSHEIWSVWMSDRYAYRSSWSEDDGMYVGLCADFRS